MILKAKERGDARQLAGYLLAIRENEHVELHDVRGFASDDLRGAFHEADAIASGTRCKNHLFSMSLNPPMGARVGVDAFEQAIAKIEDKLGLTNQPRAIVFHEKDGRRHAHAVWSRIDPQRMRAINLAHYKIKLRDVSRKLYLEHGWTMPRGLQDRSLRDPLNLTREEWQHAKRVDRDPREIKAAVRQCWERSDNRASFERALKERGFWLARGDRRGFVAVDYRGEIYSLSRYAGVKTKDIEARLGDRERLSSVDKIKAEIASGMPQKLAGFIEEAERNAKQRFAVLAFRKMEMIARQRDERRNLRDAHEKRWQAEAIRRSRRVPKGLSGIWYRLTGQYSKVKARNEHEALEAHRRDLAEKDKLIFRQLEERKTLQQDIKAQRATAHEALMRLREDVTNYRNLELYDRDHRHEGCRDNDDERKRRTRDQHPRRRRGFEP
ncbi:relaxase/mobilization nuclease domain-containing protein [Stappia stellulata]|uniref:relaxase/mobilization nuclease domain-containing protein n=1 Tax=Stappia stellulata TaxID=71235 RepID=UPI001CD26574|nr:relaxase/mobilization nuclease domain-containing protein [Stappia stellulata]MCA1241498.1 relaxase/mobilization nuclease domain-containing protein [Stappia stellulata]